MIEMTKMIEFESRVLDMKIGRTDVDTTGNHFCHFFIGKTEGDYVLG